MLGIKSLKVLIIVLAFVSVLDSTPAVSKEAADRIIIKAIHVEKLSEKETRVAFELNGYHPPKTFVIEGEKPRVVCDFPGAALAEDIDWPIRVEDAFLKMIRIGIHQSPAPKVRVVLDLVDTADVSVDQIFYKQNNFYVIFLQSADEE